MLNAILMIGTRILFAMGRDGFVSRRAASVTANGTPATAMLVTTVVALVLIATGTFQRLVAIVAFYLAANYFVVCLALIVLRHRAPQLSRPFRAWGYPWSAVFTLVAAGAFLVGAAAGDTVNAAGALGLMLAGVAVRAATRRVSSWSATG
jgi:APA family basic amino acid/polyamine antiporter